MIDKPIEDERNQAIADKAPRYYKPTQDDHNPPTGDWGFGNYASGDSDDARS